MNRRIRLQIENHIRENRRKLRWKKVVAVLAAVVVFSTTYALILPAITWEHHLVCGLEQHEHSSSCYEEVTIPASSQLSCVEEEHTHGSECYSQNSVLVCDLEENESHIHTDECYKTELVLECTKKEHVHDDNCYTYVDEHIEKQLICDKQEHVHTEACFDAAPDDEDEYCCGLTAHSHSEEQGCYFPDGTLKCTLQEHEHTSDCINDKNRNTGKENKADAKVDSEADSELDNEADEITEISTIESEPADDGAVAVITGLLPEDAAAVTETVTFSEEELIDYFGEEKVSAMDSLVAYDIKIISDGEEWQPEEPVSVVVKQPNIDLEESDLLTIAQVDSEAEEVSEVEAVIDEEGEAAFETDDLTTYIFYTFTVDFHYADTTVSMDGKDTITLSELFDALEIERDTADVRNVTFSDKSLLTAEKTEDNDWMLTSLNPFDTYETLTIELADGQTYVISVTDAQGGDITYWQKVTSIDDISSAGTYIIVSDSSKRALGVSADGTAILTPANMALVIGNDGYYSTKLDNAYWWQLSSSNGKQINMGSPTYGINIDRYDTNTVVAQNGTTNNLVYNNGYWRIRRNISNRYYYLSCAEGSAFKIVSGTSDVNMNIYKKVEKPTEYKTIKYGFADGTVFTVNVYGVEVDENGNATDVPVFLGTTTIDSNVTAGHPVVPENLFESYKNGSNINGNYYSAYYGTSSSKDRQMVTSLYRYTRNETYYLGIVYNNGLSIDNRYISTNDERALYIQYTPDSGQGGGGGGEGDTPIIDKAPNHSKHIDAFRDGADNPDTDLDNNAADLTDLYRLYLDVGPEAAYEPIDLLLVIDLSSSMTDQYGNIDATDILGRSNVSRIQALNSLLNGLNTPGTNNRSTLYANGLISRFMALNGENKIAVTGFAGEGIDVYGWQSGTGRVVNVNTGSGTNYVAGLQNARDLLNQVANDGNEKFMIFLSDGEPTVHYEGMNSTTLGGSRNHTDDETANWTTVAINQFHEQFPDVGIYTVGIGEFDPTYLDRLADSDTTYYSTNFQLILNQLDNRITRGVGHYSDLTITDTLSEFVNFADDLDLVVQMIPDGQTTGTIFYQNGALTTEGRKYIKENGVTVDRGTKTVTVDFLDNYQEEGGYIYSVSFNVKTTQKAYDDYAANVAALKDGYDGVKGDINTDYMYNGNLTSSDQPGFHSNTQASLIYKQTREGIEEMKADPYDHPVVQVSTDEIKVEKVWVDGNENHLGESVAAKLYMKYNGEEKCIKTILLNEKNDWQYVFKDLPSGEYEYRVEEDSSELEYTPTYKYDDGIWTIINSPATVSISLQKTDQSGSPVRIPGVKFELYGDKELTEYIGTYETDNNGQAVIPNLAIGSTYFIKEIKSPDGYVIMPDVREFTVTSDGIKVAYHDAYLSVDSDDGMLCIKNYTGDELPATGGIGVYIIYAIGILLIAGALIYGCILRRRNERGTE